MLLLAMIVRHGTSVSAGRSITIHRSVEGKRGGGGGLSPSCPASVASQEHLVGLCGTEWAFSLDSSYVCVIHARG